MTTHTHPQVLVHYGRGATEADGVVGEIRKFGGRADVVAADLAAAKDKVAQSSVCERVGQQRRFP
jgi:hypothetical protein